MAGILSVVATPIGNLGDLSPRAEQTLREADLIAAEDTRSSAVLLNHFGITAKTAAHHKFNEAQSIGLFLDALAQGKNVALITDAGTPCISDPGHLLVDAALKARITVVGIPGPCAAVTALSVSGFDTLSFGFYGFLPRGRADCVAVFRRAGRQYSPVSVFYESPRRIAETLDALTEALPDAAVCLCNDLTKKFERIYRGSPAEVLAALRQNPAAEKGEYCLVVRRKEAAAPETEKAVSTEAALVDCMAKTGCGLREAIDKLAADPESGIAKNEAKRAALRLKELF